MTMMRRELARSKHVDREHEARSKIAISRVLLAKPGLSVRRLAAITINEGSFCCWFLSLQLLTESPNEAGELARHGRDGDGGAFAAADHAPVLSTWIASTRLAPK